MIVMAITSVAIPNEEICPITEQFLNHLHQASPADAVESAKALPESQRAQLTGFLYNKRHFHALALMIAATCGRSALVAANGQIGVHIFHQSRDPSKTLSAEIHPQSFRSQRPISLARLNV